MTKSFTRKFGIAIVCLLAVAGIIAISTHKHAHASHHTSSPSSALPDIKNTKQWSLMFSDEFSGTTLNAYAWSTCYEWFDAANNGCTNSGNNEQEWYLPQQVTVNDGHATLTAENKPVTVSTSGTSVTYPYRSGMISTGRPNLSGSPVKFQAQYGYYEARIKMDAGQGVWPAFWLLPTNKKWPPEIDVMEFLGRNKNQILATYHWGATPAQHQEDSSVVSGPDFTAGWHTYAVNWQPGKIQWFVDGVLKKSVNSTNVPATPMQIIVNLAVGGRLPGNADSTTPFPRQMQIDYVRAYGRVL